VKARAVRPIAPGWLIGTTLLIGMMAGPALATGTISGKLTAPSGYPLGLDSSSHVNATDAQFHAFRVSPDATGAYEIDNLDPGTYSLVVVASGLETATVQNLVLKDGQTITQNVTLVDAKPFPIIHSPAPIPLTDDYNSASFQDAPEMDVNQAWQIRSGPLDSWPGPSEVSAKFKLKYSDQALHLAADINFKTPGVNNADRTLMPGSQLWDGNAIEFFFQNDPLDLNRTEYDLDHNWQLDIALADPVKWVMYQRGQDTWPPVTVDSNLLRKVKADNSGELDRLDMPFAVFLQTGANKGAISAPKLGSLGALDITINAADSTADKDSARLKFGLDWAGMSGIWQDPSQLRPIQFVAQP
jgi:carboxypeptidase family protein